MRVRAHRLPRPMLTIVLGLVASILAIQASAQVGSPEQLSDSSRLAQRVEDLERRLKELETRLDKPMTVKAPFTVADASGKPMFKVGDGGNRMALGNSSSPIFVFTDEDGASTLRVNSGKASAALQAKADGTAIALASSGGGQFARLISNPADSAVAEMSHSGQRAYMGAIDGKARVKLYNGSTSFFLVDGGAQPSLKLGDETRPAFEVRDAGDRADLNLVNGSGAVYLRAWSSGTGLLDVAGSGGRRGQVQVSPEQTAIRVRTGDVNSAPADQIQLAFDDQGPGLEIMRGGRTTAHIGTHEGKNTGLRVFDKSGALALQAGLGAGAEEASGISLWRDDQAVASLRQSFKGEAVFEVYRGEGQLAAQLGRIEQGKETALRIYNSSGELAVGAGLDSSNRPAVRVADKGKPVASMAVDTKGRGRFDIVENSESLGYLGVDSDGQPALELRNQGGALATSISAEPDGSGSISVFRPGEQLAAHLGVGSASNTALRIYGEGNKLMAGIGIDTGGTGAVRVADKAGAIVAGMSADGDGGGAVLTYHSSGKPAAALAINGGGESTVQIYSTAGEPIGSLTQGRNGGMLQLNSMSGQPMVEAGNDGTVGIVRAGPMQQGPKFFGMIPGSYIKGGK